MIDETLKITSARDFRLCNRAQKDFWRKKFLEANDPTGFVFSEEWLEDGYRHWKNFRKAYEAKSEIQEWESTLDIQLQAKAIRAIAEQKDSFQANKWLADRGWIEKEDNRTKQAKKAADKVASEVADDMARLGLKLVKK